jgi:hypothetical protein
VPLVERAWEYLVERLPPVLSSVADTEKLTSRALPAGVGSAEAPAV